MLASENTPENYSGHFQSSRRAHELYAKNKATSSAREEVATGRWPTQKVVRGPTATKWIDCRKCGS